MGGEGRTGKKRGRRIGGEKEEEGGGKRRGGKRASPGGGEKGLTVEPALRVRTC